MKQHFSKEVMGRLNTTLVVPLLLVLFTFGNLQAQEVSNDPNSENYSPADFVKIENPVDDNSSPTPIVKPLKNGGVAKTMADLTWDGEAGDSDWNKANNWNPNQVPTSLDNVTIPGGVSVELISGSDGACNSVTIQSGGTLTIGSLNIVVEDSVNVQSGGSLNNSGTIYVAGNWRNSGSFFSNSNSSVVLNGLSDQYVESSDFYSLYLQGTNNTVTALGDLNIGYFLRIYSGVTFNPDSFTISLGDDFRNDGTLLAGTSTFNFNGTSWQSLYSDVGTEAPGEWNFNDIQVTGGSGGLGIYDTLSVSGDFNVESSEYVFLLHRNGSNSDGHIIGSGGELTFAANSYILIGSYIEDGFPTGFNTITFATEDNSALCYYRAYQEMDQTVRTQEADGGQITYGRLRFEVNGTPTYTSTKTLDGDLDVDQYIYIDPESILDVSSNDYSINIWGNWNNNGDFDAQNGTVTFDGENQYIQSSETIFHDLVFAGSGGKILQVDATVSGSCLVSSGVTYLNIQTYSFNDAGTNVELKVDGTARLDVLGSSNFPSFDIYDFSPTSTVRYNRNGNQDVKTGISYGNLYLGNGSRKALDGTTEDMTVLGSLTIANNTELEINTSDDEFTLNLEGDYDNNGTLTDATSDGLTLNLQGTNDQVFDAGGTSSGRELNNLSVNKASGKASLTSDVLIDGDFTLISGTFGLTSYNRTITINGDWTTASGSEFLYGTTTVFFTGNGQTIDAQGNGDFWNVTMSGGTKSLSSDLDINNNLTIETTGDLDLNAGDLYLGGTFNNNNGGAFDADNQTLILNGTTNANLYIGSNDSLYNLTVNKSGGAYVNYDEHDLKIGGDVLLQSGLFRRGINSSTSQHTDIIVYGNWTNSGGSMLATANDTVFFAGAAQTISGSGSNDFDYLVFTGSGTKTIANDVDANRNIIIEPGITVSVSGTNILKVGRDFINNGTFIANQSTLVFEEYGSWGSLYLTTNGSSLYNLEVNLYNTNYELYLQDDIVVTNNITITQGALDVENGSDYSINCGGSWVVETNGRFNERNGLVTFDGSSSSKTLQSNGYNFYEVVLNSSGSNYLLSDDFETTEDLVIDAGVLDLNGNVLNLGNGSGDSLVVNDSIIVDDNAELRMANGSQLAVQNGGTIVVAGSGGNQAKVTNQGSGYYAFDVLSGGTIAAGYYTFEYMDADGVNVQSGATIDGTLNFSNGVFSNGTSGGTLLTVDNNQTINNISSVSFPSNPGGGAFNVTKNLNQGALTFVDPSGSFQGATYENDANNLITWSYSSSLFTWDGSSSINWDVAANWDQNAVPGSGNRVYIPSAPSNQPTISSTSDSCYHITIESGATLTFSTAKLVTTGDFTNDGTLVFGNLTDSLVVLGNWSNSGTFSHSGNGTVVFTGTNEQSIDPNGTGVGKSFSRLVIQKDGTTASLASDLQVDRQVSLISGSFDVSNYDITVDGAWMKTDTAVFNYQNRTVTFTQDDSTIYGSGVNDFYNLEIDADVDLGGSLDINGTLTINSGRDLDVSTNSYGISLQGNWTNDGSFTAQSGNVIFDGATQTIGGSATTTFYNINLQSTNYTELGQNANVDGTLTLSNRYLRLRTYTLNGTGASNLFVMSSGTQLYVDDNNFPTGFEGYSLDQASYVRYNYAGAQDVIGQDASGGTIGYGYLYMDVSGTKTAQHDLDVNGGFRIDNGVTFDLNSNDMSVGIYWVNNRGGNFVNTGSGGTITFDRDGTQYIYPNTSGDVFPNLVFSGSGAKVLNGSISVTGNLTMNTGVNYLNLQTNTVTGLGLSNSLNLSSNVTLYVRGADNFPTGFETINFAQNSIVRYDANMAQDVTTQDADGDQIQYGDIYFRYNTKTMDGDLDARGRFYVYGSTTLDATGNNYDINVGGEYRNLGTINFNANTVTFDGGEEQIVYTYGTGAGKAFNHLRINKSSDSYLRIYTYDVQVDSNVIFDGGVLANHNRTITVSGDWTATSSSTMDSRAGNVTFNGTDQIVTTGGTSDFYDVIFDGSDTTFLASDIEVLHDLNIGNSETLDVTSNNYTIKVQGDFNNYNTFVAQNGTVEFNGTGTQYINMGGMDPDEAFYNLRVNKTSGSVYLQDDLLINGSAYFEGPGTQDARFYFDENDVEVKGSWLNPEAIYVICNDETITFSGSSKDTIQAGYSTSVPSRFSKLVIDHQDSIIHVGDIRVDDGYTINQGEVYLNGNAFYFSNTTNTDKQFLLTTGSGVSKFDVGAGGELHVRGGNHVIIESASADTSIFRATGENTNIAEVTNWGGRYSFSVNSGGRIYARNYRFSYMDTSGVKIDGGVIAGVGADTTEDFSNGSFALGQNGGRYMYIVDNGQTLQIDSVSFINTIGGSGVNVEKADDKGHITFYNATGEFAGEDDERDPYDRVDWNSTFTGITWTGTVSSDWHNLNNWSGGSVPTSTDQVTIPNVATNDPLISSSDAVCATMLIESGGVLEIGGSTDLTINGGLQNYGTITVFGNDTVSVSGDYTNAGTLNAGTGTFALNGVIQKFNTGGSGNNRSFYNLLITNNTEVQLENTLRVLNSITIDAGTSLDVGANRAITVEGDWTNSGTFVYGGGTVTFNGTSTQTVTGSGTDDFNNVYFSNTGVKTLSGSIDVQGQFRVNSGSTVNGGSGTLKCNGSFYNFGTFDGQTGTVNFDGTGTSYIYGDFAPVFHDLIFSNGGNKILETDIEVDNLLSVESGVNYLNLQTFEVDASGLSDSLHLASGSRMYVRGEDNFPSTFAAINLEDGSYVRYDADLTQTVVTKDSDGDQFSYGRLELYSVTTGGRKVLDGDLIATENIVIDDLDTLDVTSNNYDVTCGGYFDHQGYFLANGAAVQNTLTLNGQGGFNFRPAGSGLGKELYDVVVNMGAGNRLTFAGSEHLYCNDFTITSGEVNPNGNRNITLTGNLVINSGEMLASGSHLYFVGTGDLTLKANGSTLNLITLDGSGKTLSLGDELSMNNNLVIEASDTLTLNGNTLNFGNNSDAITVNGVLDVDAGAKLAMANTSSMLVNSGGKLNVVGVSGNIARVGRQSGTYGIEVQGEIAASYYLFEYMNQQGLFINGGTIDLSNNFSYGTFTNGATNGRFITIDGNSQTLTGSDKIVEVQFPSTPGGTSYNVYVTNSSSASINIEDATGSFEGEGYEFDPDDVVDWTYTSVTRNWTGLTNSDWHTANNWSPKAVPDANDNVVITSKSNLPIIDTADAVCKNIELTGGSLTLRNGNTLDVSTNVTIGSGTSVTVESNLDTIKLGGNWTNSGTYTHGNSTVVFDGPNSQNISSGGVTIGKRFYNIQVDKDGTSDLNLSGNNLYLENDMNLNSGRFDAGSLDISVGGDWNNTGAEFNSSTGQVTFVGSQSNTITTNGDSFYDLTINVGSGSITANDDIVVENDMLVTSGTFDLNALALSVGSGSGDKLSIQGTFILDENATLALMGGSDGLQVESGGVLQAIGSAGNMAEITRAGSSGYYPVIMNSGGQISAIYTKFSYTNGSGVWVKNGATINTTNTLHNCEFVNGSQTSYLRISNNQVLGTITGVIFSSTGSVPSRNVYYDGFGSVLFNNYKGGLAGARYEYDNGSDPVGNVRWTFDETQSVSAGNTYTFGNDLVLTVNSVGNIGSVSVQLVDQTLNSLPNAYNRYYVISTDQGGSASGYNVNVRQYYSDGTNGSSNEVPAYGGDLDPQAWIEGIGGLYFGPYQSSSNTSENWTQYNGVTGNLEANWFVSDATEETALPVELASYGLENFDDGVSVNWTTATETDNLGFILERSTMPDSGFTQVASYLSSSALKGQGTVSVETKYEYVDYTSLMAGETYYYRLSDVDISGTRHVLETKSITRPLDYNLYQNYPNPFNPTTAIQFSLQKSGKTVLAVYDILGRKVATLLNQEMKSGAHVVNWNARNFASGIYFYRLQSGSFTQVKKMMLIK